MKPKYVGKGWCDYCEEDVSVYMVDEGIGPYEYWGQKGFHHDWKPVCSQCQGYIEDYDEIDMYDYDSRFEER